ncbi:piperideine-6-carboxylate dehydrogenase [Flavobacteria bacterium BAL38]|mgnify:FL=1|jgi:aldehyde dehydrogenase (NAD+)|uniref:L-piperidine-6-carboxylate dehydrogenase n=1 Tax=unclassified Flavobacterium TaxID=196869 RepID=UPI0000F394B5|nr:MULTISPECIES: aldehyde dehydrogenase family protein [unclassified Flavobacterium]EAZ96751.1 piperideine-6-carboxylate dehydrogenase [Flavobacteria bacterium BAL38]MDP5001323.1 aldehyde dehydrogenase family protein [Flavobacterium sp.]MDP5027955.1 aldehyde dehydrogenase family protein [Flavobacterium sp.]MQP51612.1 aldehyde dehydrogenase family protein [Flavobacterium sp. LMO9]MQP61160.1 aldehyde dehydrogenase family protein [Flavobacterium sp. LMO6]
MSTTTQSSVAQQFGMQEALEILGVKAINEGTSTGNEWFSNGELIESYSPVDGQLIGKVKATTAADYEKVMQSATAAFKTFRAMPAPQRGEIVRQFGNKLRELKEPLGKLVSYEMGKSLQEGYGEVQEMIDICDFAVGLSRQLNGQTIPSERPGHVMREQWHPIGVVGIISAFNFPVAVWSWNTALAWICGDVCVWKASEKAPLCSIACQNIIADILKANNLPEGISCIINGDYRVGEMMTNDTRIPLVSATGSTRMGRIVGAKVAERFGKSLLELGGNNAIIITPTADLKVVVPGAVFGAVGTAGQRCTSTRRLIIHESVYDKVRDAIVGAYGQLTIGNPLDQKNHIGPLIDKDAVNTYLAAIEKAKAEGGKVLVDGGVLSGEGFESGCYVKPAIIEAENHFEIVQHETFAPVLYLMKYSGEVENAIELQNGVAQGLSSAIMTNSMKEAEKFLSFSGSDCGIANVNIGTSGAEIGGAFGGEKETGGGRESGSDAWKVYMRRQTNTVNYSDQLPLAQGIKFDL